MVKYFGNDIDELMKQDIDAWADEQWKLLDKEDKRYKRIYKLYGLTWKEYLALGDSCKICGMKSSRLCVDHLHIKNWEKLPPEEKKKYVRGLLCFRCNRYGIGGIEKRYKSPRLALQQINEYFEEYYMRAEKGSEKGAKK